jgi:hypothetical protein
MFMNMLCNQREVLTVPRFVLSSQAYRRDIHALIARIKPCNGAWISFRRVYELTRHKFT